MIKVPDAHIAHKVKGRLRLRIPSKRYDRDFFESLKTVFSKNFPDTEVEVNPITASALILGNTEPKAILKFGLKRKLFKLILHSAKKQTLIGSVKESFKEVDQSLLKFTGGELDVPSFIFLGLVGHGVYQILRGNFTAPAWYTAFWYALGVFSKSSLLNVPVMIDDGGDE